MIIDGRQLTLAQAQHHISSIALAPWRASAICVHNTGAPTLAQWMKYPVPLRVQNLKKYYEGLGWHSGPHFFVDPTANGIIPFTPMNMKGTHSPSFNGTHIGIECVGDYDTEADDKGPGQEVKKNLVALLGMLHSRLGIDPAKLAMHKDDPRTTHDCPGKNLYNDRLQLIQMTREWMGHGGEHAMVDLDAPAPPKPPVRTGKVNTDGLNLRANSSVGSASLGTLTKGTTLTIYSEAMNGVTKWLQVKTPAQAAGWVVSRFVDL